MGSAATSKRTIVGSSICSGKRLRIGRSSVAAVLGGAKPAAGRVTVTTEPRESGGALPGELNLIGMTMLLQFVVSFGFILPVNAPQNMVAYGTETFAAKDFVKTGLVLTAIGYALVLLLGATYWQWMGYLTK